MLKAKAHLDMGTRIHVIKRSQCCLHIHQDTHTASKLASLLLFLSPYNLFYTHSSQCDLSKTHTSIHILPGGFPHSPWNEIQTPMKFASLSPFPLQSHCLSLCPPTHQIAAIPSTCNGPPCTFSHSWLLIIVDLSSVAPSQKGFP